MTTPTTTGTCGGDEEMSEQHATTLSEESTAHITEMSTQMEESTNHGRTYHPSPSRGFSSTECSPARAQAESYSVSAAAGNGDCRCDVASDTSGTCTPPARMTVLQSVPAPTAVAAARITGEKDEESEARASTTAGNEMLPLSPEDIKKFEEDGFVMLHRAFDPAVAAAGREHLWRRLQAEGITKNPDTWVVKHHIAEIYGTPTSPKKRRGEPWTNAVSPRLKAAVDQLIGPGTWEMFGCGWWAITFPGFAIPPWRADGRWHVDGAHFRHYPHSREIGLLPIFLFSDVRSQGGGTALLRGSHKKIAEILWKRAGKTGMKGPILSAAARESLLPSNEEDIVETSGKAGDVMLTHPLLLHARSTNLAPEEEGGVRFMCHPAVPLKEHMDFNVDPETFFPVQRVLWHSRPVPHVKDGQEGHSAVPINTPDECDHSPVHLRPPVHLPRRGGRVNRGRKRSRGMSECDHECEASARSAEEHQGHAQKRRPSPVQDVMGSAPVAPPAEGAPIAISAPSSLVNYGSAGTEEVGSENEGVGGTPGKDVLTSSPSTSPGLEDGTPTSVEGVQRLRSLSIEEEGGDEAVMALMGFSGFRGGQR